jgi:alkanesulfonate monooxygenase SsuD/methylene tetrahydromethanopterin reductase-like flavin-dependent oxidoreductase (luciferase family)
VKLGVLILPEERWSLARDRWCDAERMGFDHAWTYDHLTWRSFRDAAWFGALPTLTAAASVTRAIRLGTLVATPNFRHPVPFAKELLTLDDISAGRITLGLGAGTEGFDSTVLGHPAWSARERADRFAEFVALLDGLLTQPSFSYAGRHYAAREARGYPGCVQRPRIPFAIAATGSRGLRLAARFGAAWICVDGRGDAGDLLRRLDDACAEAGRDPASLSRLALLGFREQPLASLEAFRDARGRHAELGFSDLVVHWPRDSEPFAASRAVLERVAAEFLSPR